MANEKRLIYMEDAIALFEQDIEENKVALRTAYHGDKEAIKSEMAGMRMAIALVKSLARNGFTVDAVEVVHGRWLGTHDGWYYSYSCSECGAEALTKEETMHDQVCSNYCPNCGAKMDGDGNG